MKIEVLMKYLMLWGIVTIAFQEHVFSQKTSGEFVVEGRVNNSQGEKAIGAAILIKGTTTGTVTDTTGYFTLKVPSAQAILVVTHYSTSASMEVPVEGKKKFVIRLSEDSQQQKSKPSAAGYPVFDRVEELPRPIDGEDEWYTYLARSVKYPQSDREAGVEGTVIIGFDIREDGSIDRVAILRGTGGECDQEALRVIAEGPNWLPGKIAGEAVNTRMSLPVRFVLNKPSGEKSLAGIKDKAIADVYGQHLVVIGYLPKAAQR